VSKRDDANLMDSLRYKDLEQEALRLAELVEKLRKRRGIYLPARNLSRVRQAFQLALADGLVVLPPPEGLPNGVPLYALPAEKLRALADDLAAAGRPEEAPK
jgi:hypothetical protein